MMLPQGRVALIAQTDDGQLLGRLVGLVRRAREVYE